MLGKTNIGVGGGGLLLKVVGGTTQPTNPTENTIWINTSTAIGSVTVAYNAPATPAEGDVWVKTDNYSSLPLNVSKKDTLIIMPVSVRLYTSDAWADVTVDTKVYTGGSWMELLFIYWQYGAEYADKFMYNTAGFTVTDKPDTSTLRFVTSRASGPIYDAAIYFGPVDVTRFNKMTLRGWSTSNTKLPATIFGITKLYDTDPPPASPSANPEKNGNNLASMTIPKNNTIADHELDISSVTGEHYCYIKLSSYISDAETYSTPVEIAKIEFE